MKPPSSTSKIQADYFTYERKEMIPFVPEQCRIILEVGCGEGKFSYHLIKKNREIVIWGIEPDELASQKARLLLNKVFTGRFENIYKTLPSNYFDCIIFNDVLEHFEDPEKILKSCLLLLKSDGYIVSSIPNVRYIGNLYNLLIKKEWQYTKGGILDETHYRFFTQKSLRRLFESCGYRVIRMEGVNPTFSLKTMLLVWFTMGHSSDIRYLQFAVVAQK